MLSTARIKELIGELGKEMTEEEVVNLRNFLYTFGELAFENWHKDRIFSKIKKDANIYTNPTT